MDKRICEGVECAYCLADVDGGLPLPSITDDESWEELAEQHRDDCEWIATRAHRVEAPTITVGGPIRRDVRVVAAAWVDREAATLMDQGIRPEGPWTCGDELALPLCESEDADERREEAERINAAARVWWNELVASYA